MDELLFQFSQQNQPYFDIEPYQPSNLMSQWFLILSIAFMLLISLVNKTRNLNFFQRLVGFFGSEHAALGFYKEKQKIGFIDVLLGLFFFLQSSFLVFKYANFQSIFAYPTWMILGGLVVSFFMLFVGKAMVYNTLSALVPKKVNIKYYGFNYAFTCFYFGIFLFVLNLLLISKQLAIPVVLVLGVCAIFYIFLITRFISISSRYNILRSVYIFLYFCALEIIPIVVLFIGLSRM